MKKLLSLALASAIVLSLCACGSTSVTDESTETASASNTVEVTNIPSDKSATASTTAEVSFEPTTVIDNDACSITINEIDPDNLWGYSLKVTLENKSADTTYMFSITSATTNGVMNDPLFAVEVEPGKKANDTISFQSLADYGITEFTDIAMQFRVYDTNDWVADPVVNEEIVHVYPYGEENAANFVRETASTDNVLVDNDDVTILLTGITEDDIWGYTLNFYFINKTGSTLMYSIDGASINGYMADPYFATSVLPGTCSFSGASWSDSTLEESGIEAVESIELTFRVYDYNNILGDDIVNEVFTITP